MARSILALASVCLALTAVCAAADQNSYEGRGYGGPLGVGPNFRSSEPSQAKRHSKPSHKPRQQVKKKVRPAQQTETAKSTPEKSAPEATAPVKKHAVNQNSSITTATTDATATVQTSAQESQPKTTHQLKERPVERPVGCKRFIASIGETVSVPCD